MSAALAARAGAGYSTRGHRILQAKSRHLKASEVVIIMIKPALLPKRGTAQPPTPAARSEYYPTAFPRRGPMALRSGTSTQTASLLISMR